MCRVKQRDTSLWNRKPDEQARGLLHGFLIRYKCLVSTRSRRSCGATFALDHDIDTRLKAMTKVDDDRVDTCTLDRIA
jgi:hypothetical protein